VAEIRFPMKGSRVWLGAAIELRGAKAHTKFPVDAQVLARLSDPSLAAMLQTAAQQTATQQATAQQGAGGAKRNQPASKAHESFSKSPPRNAKGKAAAWKRPEHNGDSEVTSSMQEEGGTDEVSPGSKCANQKDEGGRGRALVSCLACEGCKGVTAEGMIGMQEREAWQGGGLKHATILLSADSN